VEWDPEHTLPGDLRAVGYQTVLVGRDMHLHPTRKRYGFDHMEICTVGDTDYSRWLARQSPQSRGRLFEHGIDGNGWMTRPWHLPEWQHPTHWTVERALQFLDFRDPSCPFFLSVGFNHPHPPLVPPACYLEQYLGRDLGAPAIGDWAAPPADGGVGASPDSARVNLQGETLQRCFAGYYGLISHIDDQLARLLRALNQMADRETYVVFLSDHGEMLGDHYMFRKSEPYEGSVHVPMIIHGPGIGPATCDQPVALQDVMPTLLDLAGLEIPHTVDGSSLLPLMQGETADWRRWVHGEHSFRTADKNAGMHFLTDGRTKYIWFPRSGREQIFDLNEDPLECRYLAEAEPDRLATWRARLANELKDRPEGFSNGTELVAGRPYSALVPRNST
jgi:arylsulfatase A-like enzyme